MKSTSIKKLIEKIKTNTTFRTLVISCFSLMVTIAFSGYNIFLGIFYQTSWNIAISVYYVLLSFIRGYVIFTEYDSYKKNYDEDKKEQIRKKLFFVQSILLFSLDLVLVAPISMMVMQMKKANYTTIPAIVMAAYTCFKIIMASRNYVKSKKNNNLSIRIIRNANLIDACVSVLSLQYTLVMTFGDGMDEKMRHLCSYTTFAIWIFLVIISLLTLIKAVKIKREKSNPTNANQE